MRREDRGPPTSLGPGSSLWPCSAPQVEGIAQDPMSFGVPKELELLKMPSEFPSHPREETSWPLILLVEPDDIQRSLSEGSRNLSLPGPGAPWMSPLHPHNHLRGSDTVPVFKNTPPNKGEMTAQRATARRQKVAEPLARFAPSLETDPAGDKTANITHLLSARPELSRFPVRRPNSNFPNSRFFPLNQKYQTVKKCKTEYASPRFIFPCPHLKNSVR